jgi:hypothetical protein
MPLNGADERTPCAAAGKDSADESAAPVERSLLNTALAPISVRRGAALISTLCVRATEPPGISTLTHDVEGR